MYVRREQRHKLHSNCRLRERGLPRRATLTNLSPGGCGIRLTRLAIRRSDTVEVSFGDRRVWAQVCWTSRGHDAGLQFTVPLSGEEVDRIACLAQRDSILGIVPKRETILDQSNLKSVC